MIASRIRLLHLLVVLAAIAALAYILGRGAGAPVPLVNGAFGRGSTVVLVHGLGSRSQDWLPTARALARDHRVVLVELPGHGVSPMPEPFSFAGTVAALDRSIAEASPGPVVLVGHSVGGLVAAAAAIEHPARVRALVLVETALKPQVEGEARDAMLRMLDEDYDGLLRAAYGSFGRDSAQGVALYRAAAALDSAAVKRWIRLALTVDLSERAAALAAPTLAVLAPHSWEDGEPWRDVEAALGYARAPRLTGVRIEGCGHFVMLDRPVELARLIARFADATASGPIAAAGR
jgi:3-oxoadipate enol-lactonase